MARFCARVRKVEDLPAVSMKDVYQLPHRRAGSPRAKRRVRSARPSRTASPRCWPGPGRGPGPGRQPLLRRPGRRLHVMTRFCAKVRKRGDLPPVAINDVYRHPTIAAPGHGGGDAGTDCRARASTGGAEPVARPDRRRAAPRRAPARHRAVPALRRCSGGERSSCTPTSPHSVSSSASTWISARRPACVSDYLRSAAVGGAYFVVVCLFPVVAKWLLVGRWTPRRFPVWGLTYSGSGWSRPWSRPIRWCSSPARPSTRCTSACWAPGSAATP